MDMAVDRRSKRTLARRFGSELPARRHTHRCEGTVRRWLRGARNTGALEPPGAQAPDTVTLLAGRRISKSFGSRLVLDSADLSVEPQARIGVVGPNGSGKSTLLKILAGQETPDGGEVSRRRGARVAYLDQHPAGDSRSALETVLAARPDLAELESELVALADELGSGEVIADLGRMTRILARQEENARTVRGGRWTERRGSRRRRGSPRDRAHDRRARPPDPHSVGRTTKPEHSSIPSNRRTGSGTCRRRCANCGRQPMKLRDLTYLPNLIRPLQLQRVPQSARLHRRAGKVPAAHHYGLGSRWLRLFCSAWL